MNQSQFLAIICNSLKGWEKPCIHGAFAFGITSHWLKNLRVFLANHLEWQSQSRRYFRQSFENCAINPRLFFKDGAY